LSAATPAIARLARRLMAATPLSIAIVSGSSSRNVRVMRPTDALIELSSAPTGPTPRKI